MFMMMMMMIIRIIIIRIKAGSNKSLFLWAGERLSEQNLSSNP